jgi:hypothetical protein
MPILTAPVTSSDLQAFPWQEVIERSHPKTCEAYSHEFLKLAYNSDAAQPGVCAAARMFAYIASLRLHADDILDPLRGELSGVALDQLAQEDIQFLREREQETADHEFRARIRDVLWLRARDAGGATAAIDDYIESAKELLPAENLAAVDRLERATRLALALSKPEKVHEIARLLNHYLSGKHECFTFIHARFAQPCF